VEVSKNLFFINPKMKVVAVIDDNSMMEVTVYADRSRLRTK
jgi:hypothetical protein